MKVKLFCLFIYSEIIIANWFQTVILFTTYTKIPFKKLRPTFPFSGSSNFSSTVPYLFEGRKFFIFYLVEKIKKFARRTQNVICENGSLHKDLIRIKITPQDMLIKQQSASRTFGRSLVKKRSTLSAWIATISRACSKKSGGKHGDPFKGYYNTIVQRGFIQRRRMIKDIYEMRKSKVLFRGYRVKHHWICILPQNKIV